MDFARNTTAPSPLPPIPKKSSLGNFGFGLTPPLFVWKNWFKKKYWKPLTLMVLWQKPSVSKIDHLCGLARRAPILVNRSKRQKYLFWLGPILKLVLPNSVIIYQKNYYDPIMKTCLFTFTFFLQKNVSKIAFLAKIWYNRT